MSMKLLKAAFGAGLAFLTLGNRAPEFNDQSAPAAQAPARRHDDQDETHHDTEMEQHVPQGLQEQAPPAQVMPPGRGWVDDQAAEWPDDWWDLAVASSSSVRNSILLDSLADRATSS